MTSLLSDSALLDGARTLRADREPEEVLAAIAWSVLTEPGDAVGGELRRALGVRESFEVAVSSDRTEAVSARAFHEAKKRWRPRADIELIRGAMTLATHSKASLMLPDDADWPDAASDLGAHAPILLWVRGRRDLLTRSDRSVALVGARAATPYGDGVAREISGDLAAEGTPVVSGGAYGIDGAAHRAALGVGGDTVAVLAGGIDRAYPSGHTRLLTEIAERGAVLAEVPCGTTPTKWRFLARNRLISALSGATVVVEAGWRSGSLNTAGHAVTLGRPLGAVPGPITSATSAGCHRLLREYDAHCVTSAAEVRELLGEAAEQSSTVAPVDREYMRLADAMSTRSFRTPLDIAQRSGLAVEQVESMLGVLALEGRVMRNSEGWRSIS